jgi:hypothetical protein
VPRDLDALPERFSGEIARLAPARRKEKAASSLADKFQDPAPSSGGHLFDI